MSAHAKLRAVVKHHAEDLRGCAPVLRAHGLGDTAKEVEKAAAELESALAQPQEPTQRELSMAMMIRMLCSHTANDSTRKRAMELLARNDLQGSPLRSTGNSPGRLPTGSRREKRA